MSFTLFKRLPAELRVMIWQLCLPRRVRSCVEARDELIWDWYDPCGYWTDGYNQPCELKWTEWATFAPPVISQVCREARRVALAAGRLLSSPYGEAEDEKPISDFSVPWFYAHEIRHSYYWSASTYDMGEELVDLLEDSAHPQRDCAFTTLHYTHLFPWLFELGKVFGRPWPEQLPQPESAPDIVAQLEAEDRHTFPRSARLINHLSQRRQWYCVLDIVIVHTSPETATATGLFGLLGDEPIQLVDVCDEAATSEMWALAQQGDLTADRAKQELTKRSTKQWLTRFERCLWGGKYPKIMLERVRPVVMFRLCTQWCNRLPEGHPPLPARPRRWWDIEEIVPGSDMQGSGSSSVGPIADGT